jgi:hypothetical protein
MNCRDFREFIDSYLSDELLTETNHDILRHLEDCRDCRAEIEGRRMVRARVRSAVRSAPEYEIAGRFTNRLQETLRTSAGVEKQRSWNLGFGRQWVVLAAAAAVVVTVTFGILYYVGPGGGNVAFTGSSKPVLAALLPATHLVNMAANDHDHCAVRYASDKPPVEVAQVPPRYRDIADVVSHELKGVLKDCDLIDSHSCKFGNTRFTHVILRDRGNMISVLVTNAGPDASDVSGKILSFASDKYAISQFDYGKQAVFVVSDLDSKTNDQAAKALFIPIRNHLGNSETPGAQPTLLFAR